MNIALCFSVRNCGKYLPDIFKNIELVRTLNVNVFCIFVYDNCSDNSESLLLKYKNKNKNVIVKMIENTSPSRVTRIAKARNVCLEILYNTLEDISFHIMIDSDDKGAHKWNIDIINKYLHNFDNDDWDCISFNREGFYDIWALLYDDIKQHSFGYNPGDCPKIISMMREDIINRLQNLESNSIEVMSAFNGLCIYKTKRFKGFYYDGLYENFKDLFTDIERDKTVKEIERKFNLIVEINHNSFGGQCCEHLFYHVTAFKKGRKIKVSKFKV